MKRTNCTLSSSVKIGLQCSQVCLNKFNTESQVLGADVPSYRNFPYKAQQTLHLYRHFLQLIYHYHAPQERPDLLFRLRNEFASRRHLTNAGLISAAIRRGQGFLTLQRQILDARQVRQRRIASPRDGAQSVDGLWQQLQIVSGNVLPGLQNYPQSRSVSVHGGYLENLNYRNVRMRRRQRRGDGRV